MSEINYGIFNTLNLINQKLGKLYVEEQFNPFEDKYKMDQAIAEECISLRDEKSKLQPKILESSEKELIASITQSKFMGDKILLALQAEFLTPNETTQEVKKYLEIRQMLLNLIDLEEPNYEEIADVIKTEMCLDKVLSKYMEKSYYRKFQLESAIEFFKKLCQENKLARKKVEEKELANKELVTKRIKLQTREVNKTKEQKVQERTEEREIKKAPPKRESPKMQEKKTVKKVHKEEVREM